MHLTSPSRRALGLLAAGTLGVGSTVFGVGGVAAADTLAEDGVITVPANTCSVSWTVAGASGGDAGTGTGGLGGTVSLTTLVAAGEEFYVEVGSAGASGGLPGTGSQGRNGGYGGSAAAGGGGATVLHRGDSTAGDVLAIGAGGGGAGTDADGGNGGADGSRTIYVMGGSSPEDDAPGRGGAGGAEAGATDGSDSVGTAGGAGAEAKGGGGGGGLFGGGGGGSDDVEGAGGAGGSSWAEVADDYGSAALPGAGYVTYTFTQCAVPDAPGLTLVGTEDGTAIVEFWPADVDETDPASPVTGWEYTLDGGAPQPLAIDDGNGQDLHTATIDGLTNGQTYSIRVHATAASGDGAASNAVSATPFLPAGAPGGIEVSTAPSEVTFSWDAAAPGTYDIDGYVAALVLSHGESGGPVYFCENGPDERTCTVPATPGLDYTVAVHAVDVEGHEGEMSPLVPVGNVPAPATVPASDGTLTAPAATTDGVAAGDEVTFSGTGFAPYSVVTLLVYSEPQVLGTVMTDGDGAFTATVPLPEGLAAGTHTLVAAGLGADGEMRYLTLPITVGSGSGGQLAYTGASVTGPAIGGAAALLAGAGLLVASRRRSAR